MKNVAKILLISLLFTFFCNISLAERSTKILEEKGIQNIDSMIHIEGKDNKGLTFVTHDIYYDGYFYYGKVTIIPEEEGYYVVNYNYSNIDGIMEDDIIPDLTPIIGSSDLEIEDLEGKEIGVIGLGISDGSSGKTITNEYRYCFRPEDNRPSITTNYYFYMKELPNFSENRSFRMYGSLLFPKKEVEVKEVPLHNLPEKLSYIQKILLVQSDEMASVYVYFEPTRNTDFPVSFVQDSGSLQVQASVYKEFIFEAFPTGNLEKIRIKDMLSFKDYEIDLAQGTFTLLDAK